MVKKENPNPLDLSVTKKEEDFDEDDVDQDEDISIEIKDEVNKNVEVKNEASVKHEIAKLEETKDHQNQPLDDQDLDEEVEDDDEDYEEMEDHELMADHDPPEEEPKGFKPLQEGKSFIPIKDQVTFKPYSDAPSSTPSSTPKTPLNGDPSSLSAAMTNSSSVPPTYPRPINPLILEAMYRMQTQRQSPFGGFYGGSTPTGAPRPPYPFPPSLMAAAGLNGSPFGHSRYPGTDLFHPLHHHASHGGHPICNKPKDR